MIELNDPGLAADEMLRRRRARSSLIEFTEYTKADFRPADHHRWIASALERVDRGECKRLMLFMPPRHGKSELASRRFPAWYLGKHPTHQMITATYSTDFALDFGREVKHIVGDHDYRNIFDMSLAADSQASGRWHTDKGGVYYAVGVGGPITGRGAHVALIDDPVKNRQDAESEVIRNATWNWYTSTLRPRLMPFEDANGDMVQGAIVLICTRWHEDDLAGRLLANMEAGGEQWEVVSLQALREEDGQEKALWPAWYPLDELKRIQSTIGPRDWLSLYQQTPTHEEGTYFKREWFQSYMHKPEHLTVYMSGDFATLDGAGDFTEIGVWGVSDRDQIYLLDWWSGQTTSDVWVDRLLDLAQIYQPQWFIGEGGQIRRSVEPWLKKRMDERKIYVACEWLPSSGDKASMARSFQAMASCEKVHFPNTVQAAQVLDQLLKFPAGKYDDKVDACSLFGRFIARTWAPVVPEPPKVPDFGEQLRMQDFEFNRPRGLR